MLHKKFSISIEPSSKFISFKKDGDVMRVGEKAFEVEASVHIILHAKD